MKKPMATYIFILIVVGIVYLALFHNPQHYSEAELKKWFSSRLSTIAENLQHDIDRDKKGQYPHSGKQSFDRRGVITYQLRDKHYARFDVSDKNNISRQDIIETEGYSRLESKVRELDLSIRLEERNVEGDGVESFDELDEYTDDFPRYYTITISGW